MASDLMSQKSRLSSSSGDGKAIFSKSLQHQIKRSYVKVHLSSLAMLLLHDECTANRGKSHTTNANSKLRLLRQSKGNSTDNFLSLLSGAHHSAKTTTWVSPTPASPSRIISKVPRTPNVYTISMETATATATRGMRIRLVTTRVSNEQDHKIGRISCQHYTRQDKRQNSNDHQ